MVTLVCPHCRVAAHFSPKWSEPQYDDPYVQVESYTAFARLCDNCKMPVCGVYPEGADEGDETVWPIVVARVDYPDVPDAIAGAAREAQQALAASAARASVLMARATLEATAKDRGIATGTLGSKIEKLSAQGLISQDMKEVADEIRLAGNEAAHGDILYEPISIADAKEIVELMDAKLMRIYQEPAKVARVRASRLARQGKPQKPGQPTESSPGA
jgi:Domain of unknown function (DUF4145)